jgi:hypothetical protein
MRIPSGQVIDNDAGFNTYTWKVSDLLADGSE